MVLFWQDHGIYGISYPTHGNMGLLRRTGTVMEPTLHFLAR